MPIDKISFCGLDDKDNLKRFIKNEWSEDHIFVISDLILDFQHKDGDQYNFVISKNDYGEISGVLGFIPNTKYS